MLDDMLARKRSMGLEIILFNNDLDDDGGGDIRQDDRKDEEDEEDRDESSNRLDERRRNVLLIADETSAMYINNNRTGRVVTVMRLNDKDGEDNDRFLRRGSIEASPGIGESAGDCTKRMEKHDRVVKTVVRSAHEMFLSPVTVEMSTRHPCHGVVVCLFLFLKANCFRTL